MKPFVIFIGEQDKDKVVLTKQEFEDFLKKAYDSGHSDGYSEGFSAGTSCKTWTSPYISTTPYYDSDWWKNPTCGTSTSSGTPIEKTIRYDQASNINSVKKDKSSISKLYTQDLE